METYSLLRLKPNLFSSLSGTKTSSKSNKNSLYKLLDGLVNGAVGKRVRAQDGSITREYTVEKYERFKAGLMGRVWLKRTDKVGDGDGSDATKLISDTDALGLKWKCSE